VKKTITKQERENRTRLIGLLDQISTTLPPQWFHVGSVAVGGLASVGFSKRQPHLLLVVSVSGRGLFDCSTAKKSERDYEEDAGMNHSRLTCMGIGPLHDEEISLSGINGGGLRTDNDFGDSLISVAPNWPERELFLAKDFKSPLVDGHQSHCSQIYAAHELRAFGFSWCGNYIVAACSSDF